MMFRNYIDARMFYQQSKKWLTLDKLKAMIIALDDLNKSQTINLREKIAISDLKIDVEHHIDLIEDPHLLSNIRSEGDETMSIKVKSYKKELDTSDHHDIESFNLSLNNISISRNLFDEVIKDLLVKVLLSTKDNRTQAALILGVSIKTLYNRLNKYELINKR